MPYITRPDIKPTNKNLFKLLCNLPLDQTFFMTIRKAISNKNVASKLKILIFESGCFNDGIKFVEKAIKYELIS